MACFWGCRYGLVAIRATLSASIAHSGNTPLLQDYGPVGHSPAVSLWPGGHTRHIERVYCPFGQYAAFAGLWPGGP